MAGPSYACGTSHTPLIGRTIGAELDRVVAATPDALAVVSRHQHTRLSYQALHVLVERAARALLAGGVEKGDRVGIWSGNCVEWMVVQYATAKIGAILVNVNPAYRRHELAYALGQSGVSVLVAARTFRHTNYLEILDAVVPELPALRTTVLIGDASGSMRGWDEFLDTGTAALDAALRQRESALDFDDPINVQYTSGTTGFPKGATLSHHNILNNGFFVGQGCGGSALLFTSIFSLFSKIFIDFSHFSLFSRKPRFSLIFFEKKKIK